MLDVNVTILEGRLVRDPVIYANGTPMGFFKVAANHRYQGKPLETAFVPCKCFGNWTKALAGHKQGDMVRVLGRLKTETWGDAQKEQLVVVCQSVQFMVVAFRSEPQTADAPAPENREPPAGDSSSDPKMPPV